MKNLKYIDRSNDYYKSKYDKGFDVRLPFLDDRKKKKYLTIDMTRNGRHKVYVYFKEPQRIKKENLTLDRYSLENYKVIWYWIYLGINTIYLLDEDGNIFDNISFNAFKGDEEIDNGIYNS